MTRPLEKVDHAEDCDAVNDYGVPAEPVRRPCNCGLDMATEGLRLLEEAASYANHTYACGNGYGTGNHENCDCGYREVCEKLDAWRARQ